MGKLNHHTLRWLDASQQLLWRMIWQFLALFVLGCESYVNRRRVFLGREFGAISTRHSHMLWGGWNRMSVVWGLPLKKRLVLALVKAGPPDRRTRLAGDSDRLRF
ncbi:MAG: hypothetical protein AAF497_05275 [Planctomycetota bacterium]